jgi:hypothetical protein
MLEQQSASTNSAVMRMEEMMMRMLTGLPPPRRTTKMDEIEHEIETMRLTNQDNRRMEVSGTQIVQHKTKDNV